MKYSLDPGICYMATNYYISCETKAQHTIVYGEMSQYRCRSTWGCLASPKSHQLLDCANKLRVLDSVLSGKKSLWNGTDLPASESRFHHLFASAVPYL